MVKARDQVEEKYKWDLDKLFESDEGWEEAFKEVSKGIEKLEIYEGKVTESPETLLELLELREDLKRTVSDLSSYANKKYDQDTRKDKYQAMKSRVSTLSSKLSSNLSFIDPEIQSAGRERIDKLMEENRDLEVYKHFFDNILRFKPHTRSHEVEEVLANLGDVLDAPDTAFKAMMNADMEFPTVEKPSGESVEITQSNFTNLLKNQERGFRSQVHEQFYSKLNSVENTIATNFEKNIRRNVKMADIKNFESARKASLFSSNVPVDVYDNLVGAVEGNLDPLHSHLELKKQVLEVDKLRPEDVYMPVVNSEGPEISYEKAKEHVIEAVAPLGEEYQEAMKNGLNSGWVDVYENKGKRSGAYSSATYDSQPYILMNYQDDVSSMYTLAHELGHSMHSYYTQKNQPYVYSSYSIFVAEVASTVNEALLTRHLLENAENEELRKHALSHYLENFRNTLFRQAMFADFEKKVHDKVEEGEALTSGSLTKQYGELKEKYHKPVELDEYIKTEWMRIPHFYYNFYVYQYSTGISAAETLVEKIISEGSEDYIEFLSTGSREYPVDALRIAGVDMESPQPVETAIEKYSEYVKKAEEEMI